MVPPPDYWGRKSILEVFFKTLQVADDFDLTEILQQTEGVSDTAPGRWRLSLDVVSVMRKLYEGRLQILLIKIMKPATI